MSGTNVNPASGQEVRLPREAIEKIARESWAADIEAVKADVAKKIEGLNTDADRLDAVEKGLEEMQRLARERSEAKRDSAHAGLSFDPNDRNDPVVKHFNLGARSDRINGVEGRGLGVKNAGPLKSNGLGLRLGLYLRACGRAYKTNRTIEAELKQLNAGWMVDQIEAWVERESTNRARIGTEHEVHREKALGTIVAGSGATLVPQEYSEEVVELLRNATVFLAAGPVEIPIPAGGVSMGRITSASTAAYKGESSAINASQPGTGELVLQPRDLYGIVPVADKLFGVNRIEQVIRDEMVRTMTVRLDLAALRGDGTDETPRGLRFWATDGTTPDRVIGSSSGDATPTSQEIADDLRELSSLLAESNIAGTRKTVFLNPRTEHHIMYHVDANGAGFLFREEMMNGRIGPSAYFATNQIPTNLSPGTASELISADMAEIMHGVHEDLSVDVFPAGAYVDSGGTMQSALSRGETVLRATFSHDVRPRHVEAVAVVTDVLY